MKRIPLLALSSTFALLVGTAASAATTSGKVVATDALTHLITVETDAGARFLFARNEATKIEAKGAEVAPGDLAVDTQVIVTSEQAPADPLVPMLANRVQVIAGNVKAPAPDVALEAGAVRVESAGKNGGMPIHTAEVQSAEVPANTARLARPLPLVTALVAGSLLVGAMFMLWRGSRRQSTS